MKGFCKDCGQMHLVDAKSQKEADTIATDKCECESEAKWFRLMKTLICYAGHNRGSLILK